MRHYRHMPRDWVGVYTTLQGSPTSKTICYRVFHIVGAISSSSSDQRDIISTITTFSYLTDVCGLLGFYWLLNVTNASVILPIYVNCPGDVAGASTCTTSYSLRMATTSPTFRSTHFYTWRTTNNNTFPFAVATPSLITRPPCNGNTGHL